MSISFTTGQSNVRRKTMYAPMGAERVSQLPGFDDIKEGDLIAGTAFGATPTVDRTDIDPVTHTYLHGQEGELARLKRAR